MERADNLIANKYSFGKAESEVRAFALNGVNFSLMVNDQDGIFGFGSNKEFSHLSIKQVVLCLKHDQLLREVFGC